MLSASRRTTTVPGYTWTIEELKEGGRSERVVIFGSAALTEESCAHRAERLQNTPQMSTNLCIGIDLSLCFVARYQTAVIVSGKYDVSHAA
jgi:hypothetical protein